MKYFIISLFSVFTLLGCKKEYEGQFKVLTPTELNAKRETIVIQKGVYSASLRLKKNLATVKIDLGNDSEKFDFALPEDMTFPTGGGEFHLPASQTGQPSDLHGILTQSMEQTEPRRGRESCTYQRTQYECYYDQYGRHFCQHVVRTYHGSRDIEYYDIQTIQDLKASLGADKRSPEAVFTGTNVETERKYLSIGPCW